jgi:hypothetical protein
MLTLDVAPHNPFSLRDPTGWVIVAGLIMVGVIVRFVLHRLRGPKGGAGG